MATQCDLWQDRAGQRGRLHDGARASGPGRSREALANEEGVGELTRGALEGDRVLPAGRAGDRQGADAAPHHDHGRRIDQGAVRPVPEGPGQEGGPHLRPRQARGLRLSKASASQRRGEKSRWLKKTRKVAFICSKGNLDMAYPALVMGWAALGNGIDVTIFFTFWGLDMIRKDRVDHLEIPPRGQHQHEDEHDGRAGQPRASRTSWACCRA